jgi:hypothetical protein
MKNILLFADDICEINDQQAKNFKSRWYDEKNDIMYYSNFKCNEETIKNHVKMEKEGLKAFHDRVLNLYKNFNINTYKKDAWEISNDLSCDYYNENKDGFIIEKLIEANVESPREYLKTNGLFLWKVLNTKTPFTHITDLKEIKSEQLK